MAISLCHTWRRYPHAQRMRQCPACGMLQVYRGKQWHVSLHSPTQAERGATSMTSNTQPADMAKEQDVDGRLTCPHEDAVKWNPWNNVVQCHRCGQQFVPMNELSAAHKQIAALEAREKQLAQYVWLLLPSPRQTGLGLQCGACLRITIGDVGHNDDCLYQAARALLAEKVAEVAESGGEGEDK